MSLSDADLNTAYTGYCTAFAAVRSGSQLSTEFASAANNFSRAAAVALGVVDAQRRNNSSFDSKAQLAKRLEDLLKSELTQPDPAIPIHAEE